jgi:hypothetical protein
MLTEKTHTGGFLISEADGKRSRENVTLISGQDLYPGAVLGKITTGGKYTALDQGASDGSQTAAGILYGRGDASTADLVVCIIARDAEVNGNELLWGSESPTEVDTGITELATLGIIVR